MGKIQSNPFFIKTNEATYNADISITRLFIAYDVKVIFEKEAIGYQHKHEHVQTIYVVSGKFEVTIGNKSKILSAGDGFYAEPNILHDCVCLEAGVQIGVFKPIREDFYETIS